MRENELNPRKGRRFVRTTDSAHGGPVFPFVARGLVASGPDQLWVGDITYVAIAQGFVYLSVILDAWSRRVVGFALARDLEARHSVAALERAIALRRPPPGCVFHSDRGVQYASVAHRVLLAAHGLTGSMSRRGNPYDNAKAESFMKTLKAEAVYLDRVRHLRGGRSRPAPLHRGGLQCPTPALRPGLPEPDRVREPQRPRPGQNRRLILSNDRGALHCLPLGRREFRACPRHARADYRPTVPAAPPSASALTRSSRRTGARQCLAFAGSARLSWAIDLNRCSCHLVLSGCPRATGRDPPSRWRQ